MSSLVLGIILIVVTNIATAVVCIMTARGIIRDQEDVYDRLLERRDKEIETLRETITYEKVDNLKFNVD